MRRPAFRPALALSLAVRGLLRDPGSSLVAVGVLAVGLAAPVTVFSGLRGAVRPLPVPGGERIVRVEVVQPEADGRRLPVTGRDLAALQGASGLAGLAGFRTFQATLVDPEGITARISAAALTPGVFELLEVGPAVGRIPGPVEAHGTVVLGHRVWEDAYDADPRVLGRSVKLDGVSRTVVGVAPEGFGFPYDQEAWVVTDPTSDPSTDLELVGRLAPGTGPDAVEAQLEARWRSRDGDRGARGVGGRVRVEGYTRGVGEGGEATAFAGLVLVGLCLLLIACANVANLLLVRATDRVRALAVQSALGAGRLQIGGQLLLESLLLAAAGGAVGLALAGGVVAVLERTLAAEHFGYYWMRLAVDGPVLAATAALVVGTALVAGILPVIRVLRVDVQRVLKEEGAGLGVGGGGGWSRAFVTAQLAVSCGAVVVAALTGRSLAATRDFGGDLPSEEVLVAGVGLPAGLDGEDRGALLRTLETSLSTGTGAREAALALAAPGYRERYSPVELRGTAPEPGSFTLWNAVSPDFLATLDIPLRAGRGLTRGDDAGSAPVALVSESFVRRHSPGEPVLGRAVRLSAADSAAWFTVVGVVADVELGVGAYSRPDRVLVPLAQVDDADVMAVLRAPGPASSLTPALRSAVAEVGPDLPIWMVRTLADAHATILRVPRVVASLAVLAGGVGLAVAGVGLYGLLAFRVRTRRRELALRVALGARGGRLAGDVLLRALGQIAPAAAVGLAAAWIAAPWLQVMLMGAEPRSPVVFGAVGVAFAVAGLGAALLPARGAARVDAAAVLGGD